MSRQVDIKALVSHVVRGDGINKCRICMGDTSEGQVFLGDTVLMDGDQPVTLSELLETITGVQVEEAKSLPRGVCSSCTQMTLSAAHFRNVCHESANQWTRATSILNSIPPQLSEEKAFFLIYNKDAILKDNKSISSISHAISRLNQITQEPILTKSHRQKSFTKGSPWKCKSCGKKFRLLYTLNIHLRMTTNRACTHCGLIINKKRLHQHLKRAHGILLFHCDTCHRLFKKASELDLHIQTAHSVISYSCPVCKQGFVNERALRAHKYAHTLFNCLSCNSSFENLRCYRYHIGHCQGSKAPPDSLYECDYCGYKYIKKDSLRSHIQNKHLKVLQFVCQKCGKRSTSLAHHKAHEVIHKTEREVFKCHCGAKLTTQLGFNLHQRIHSGEKPYECKICGERFLSTSRRLDHMKRRHMNTEDMPHKCRECSASFIRPSLLKKHYKVVHGVSS
ncbi:PREDICTED: zinc finger protein 85-like isoform X3 [Papilio polytes]|uniref:zinc finger protein 85-like isoform X3 n=1 Tax=Papilio polytes TaxID=76194 RepID=UPI00067670C3|nr:PREDICTED: zinc finger protein 85-like isoform X3 [Papilio polytes]